MKRIITIIIVWVAVLGLHARVVETIRIYTDKECYLAGEYLWIKVCVTDSLLRESKLSKVAYIEVGDTKQVYAQGKINLQDGNGWGRIKLPQTMHTGTYQLTAYTRYMRNGTENNFSKKYIALLNTFQATEEDDVKLITDTLSKVSSNQSGLSTRLLTDKSIYGNRSKVTLVLPKLPADIKEMSVSVVRKDCKLSGFPVMSNNGENGNHIPNRHFIAECEGHIVTGKLIGETANSVNAQLSCIGKDIRIFDGQPQSDSIYVFYTAGLTDMQEIVLTALPEKESTCRLEIVSPFAGIVPQALPKLRLSIQEDALIERSFGAQLHPILPFDSIHKQSILNQLHDFVPVSTYNLDEYTRFNKVRELFTEFITGIRISKLEDKNILRILQSDIKQFSNQKALVLLDGVPVEDHEAILDYNSRLVHYIHRYTGKYTFGGELYDGIVSFVTHKGTMPDIRLDKNSQLFSYEFPQNRPAFIAPIYQTEEQINSRIPDFRHTLYWNPEVAPNSDGISFYTSDLDGTYSVVLQGILNDGKEVKIQSEFRVGKSH